MILKKLIPTLMVKDVDRTIEFYRTVLGFDLVQVIPDVAPFDWARMQCGEVEVAFQEESGMTWDIPEMRGMGMGGSLTLQVQVDGVDALYQRVKDNAEISQHIFTFDPGVRQFRMRDCNGYFWVFEEKSSPQ
ncbi:MAG: VOC family protein [Anaerolineae bacterium]|nr:VOC family protein [Anaerolineae bacterium]